MRQGSSWSGIRCSTAIIMIATGLLKSSVLAAALSIRPVSRKSASMKEVVPWVLVSRARAWVSTMGSLST